MLKSFRQHIDSEWIFINRSVIKAHQHSTGASGQNLQAIGKSVAGNSTKIHLAVDSCRNPIDFVLRGGEVHDSKAAPELEVLLPDSETIVADRGNDDIDWRLYRYRYLVI
ncbi:hypothetical protein B0183_11625 [Glaesserella parasuis]|nr:hypothetical protein B0183_11625 [Glaesserella parasuis]STO81541.1 transposase, IS4 family protein [Glaesserella parasuis]